MRLHLRYADYAASRPFLKTMDPDMVSLEGYLRHLPPSRLWVNPDYGLKTRRPKAVGNLIGGEDG
ncbi:hypothetical protein [Thermus tengchongensis]|uniref:hypothetical protein n=1 Tax=Thermus tengchongensis TaxID=1214928 RepID=UPI0019826276|nr:hypothetical protein [Thermus tengchongensis]